MKDLFILGVALPGGALKTMVKLCLWPSIVLLRKLAIYCNYIWIILRMKDFYALGLCTKKRRKKLELYTDLVFLASIRFVFLGIYQTNTGGKLGR
jgi:hypothetical protein